MHARTHRPLVHVDLAVGEVGQLLEGVDRNQDWPDVRLFVFKLRGGTEKGTPEAPGWEKGSLNACLALSPQLPPPEASYQR